MRALFVVFVGAIWLNVAWANANTITLAYSLENYDLSRYFETFTRQTGIQIHHAQLSTSDMKTEILVRADAHALPDAVIVPGDLLGLTVAEFGEVPANWLSAETTKNTRRHGKVKGVQLGIPIIAGNHLLLYYNKSHIAQPASNWQELLTQKPKVIPGTRLISWSYNEMFWLIPFLGAYDAFPYGNNAISLNLPGIGEALEFYKALADNGTVEASCNYQCAFDAFVNEKVTYTINGSWSLGGFGEKLGANLGVALLPDIGANAMRPYSSVHALAFPNRASQSGKKALLQQLSLFLQSYDIQYQIWQDISALPVNNKVLQHVKAHSSDNTQNLLTQLQQSEPMPNDPEMAIVWEALLMGFNRFQGGAMDVEETLAYMQYIADKSWRELSE